MSKVALLGLLGMGLMVLGAMVGVPGDATVEPALQVVSHERAGSEPVEAP